MVQERLQGDPFPNTQCEVSMSVFVLYSKWANLIPVFGWLERLWFPFWEGLFIPPIYLGSFPPKKTHNVKYSIQGGPLSIINGGYNFHKWGYNSSYPCIRPFIEVITPFITGRGPPCMFLLCFFLRHPVLYHSWRLEPHAYPKWWALEKVAPFQHGHFWYLC